MPKDTILLLDDNENILKLLELFFADVDVTVKSFDLPLNALEWLKKNTVDLIICDLMMPQMDGIEFYNAIRSDSNIPFMPFVVLTSVSNEKMENFSFSFGVDEYLRKPIDKKTLCDTALRLLEQTKDFRISNKNKVSIVGRVVQSFDETVLKQLHAILMSQKTGTFEIVKNQVDEGFIWIKNGQFYDAKYKSFSGKKAIDKILQFSSGDYVFSERPIGSIKNEINENPINLLMDICKDMDEKRLSISSL